eukprot:PhF_6_TR40252/c0_g1_i1/m.59930
MFSEEVLMRESEDVNLSSAFDLTVRFSPEEGKKGILQAWGTILKAEVSDVVDMLQPLVLIPRRRQDIGKFLSIYCHDEDVLSKLILYLNNHFWDANSSSNTNFALCLILQCVLAVFIQKSTDVEKANVKTMIKTCILPGVRSWVKLKSLESEFPFRLDCEMWNLFTMSHLCFLILYQCQDFLWEELEITLSTISMWNRINERGHRSIMCAALDDVHQVLKDLGRKHTEIEFLFLNNSNPPVELVAAKQNLNIVANRCWLETGAALFERPSLFLKMDIPSCVVGGPSVVVGRPLGVYDTMESLVNEVWKIIEVVQRSRSQQSDGSEGWLLGAMQHLALVIGRIPTPSLPHFSAKVLGNITLGNAIREVLTDNILRNQKVNPRSQKLASVIVTTISLLPTESNDVTIDSFVPMLEESDAAARCGVEIVAHLAKTKPNVILPRLFKFLEGENKHLRTNSFHIIDSLIKTPEALSETAQTTLTSLLVDSIENEELNTRLQLNKILGKMPYEIVIPQILSVALSKDDVGIKRSTVRSILNEIAIRHSHDVRPVILALRFLFSKNKSTNAKVYATPSDLTRLALSPSAVGTDSGDRMVIQQVSDFIKQWADHIPEDKTTRFAHTSSLLNLYLEDTSRGIVLRVLSFISQKFDSKAIGDVISKHLVPVDEEHTVGCVGPVMCLNMLDTSCIEQLEASEYRDSIFPFLESIVNAPAFPEELKKVSVGVLAKRSLPTVMKDVIQTSIPLMRRLFIFCCALTVRISSNDRPTTSVFQVFHDAVPKIFEEIDSVLKQDVLDDKQGRAFIDVIALMILFEIKGFLEMPSQLVDPRVSRFVTEKVSSHCMDLSNSFVIRSVYITSIQQSLFYYKQHSANFPSGTIPYFTTLYLESLIQFANAACVGSDWISAANAINAIFSISQHHHTMPRTQQMQITDLSINSMKFHRSPEIQFEALKLFGALLSTHDQFMSSNEGLPYFSKCLVEVTAMANMHSIPNCRTLATNLLALMTNSK